MDRWAITFEDLLDKAPAELKDYTNWLCVWCASNAWLQSQAEDLERGFVVGEWSKIQAISLNETATAELSKIKEQLGYSNGFNFTEDQQYMGFGVRSGRFYGNREAVLDVVKPFLYGFPETSNNYQYEASMFVLCLAGYAWDSEYLRRIMEEE